MKKSEKEKPFITKESINLSEQQCDVLYIMGKDLIIQDRNTCINYAITSIINKHSKLLEGGANKDGKHKDKTNGKDIFNS